MPKQILEIVDEEETVTLLIGDVSNDPSKLDVSVFNAEKLVNDAKFLALENAPDNDTVYDDSGLSGRVSTLESIDHTPQDLSPYRSASNQDLIDSAQNIAISGKSDQGHTHPSDSNKLDVSVFDADKTGQDGRLSALENAPDNDTVYDDSGLSGRVSTLESIDHTPQDLSAYRSSTDQDVIDAAQGSQIALKANIDDTDTSTEVDAKINIAVSSIPATDLSGKLDVSVFDAEKVTTDGRIDTLESSTPDLSNYNTKAEIETKVTALETADTSLSGRIDTLENPPLTIDEKIAALFKRAVNQTAAVKYIVSGDSTKNGIWVRTREYYPQLLNQLNVNVYSNTEGGVDSVEWNNDVTSTGYAFGKGITDCINQISGTGENTIVEYSFGINDKFFGYTDTEILASITLGINQVLAAKPDVIIILVEPVYFHSTHSAALKIVYSTLATNFGLKLVSVTDYMATYHPVSHTGQPQFYGDYTHPNEVGSRRMVNIILNQIVPNEFKSLVSLPEFIPAIADSSDIELMVGTESGHYDFNNGDAYNSSYQRALPFLVTEGKELTLVSTGNVRNIAFFDNNGLVYAGLFQQEVGDSSWRVPVPEGATLAKATLHNSATAITASIKYSLVPRVRSLASVINQGVSIGFSVAVPVVDYVEQSEYDGNKVTIDGRISTLEGATDNDTIYDDSAVTARVTTLEALDHTPADLSGYSTTVQNDAKYSDISSTSSMVDSDSGSKVPTPDLRSYFESKNGLVTNGSGFMGTNYNFSLNNILNFSDSGMTGSNSGACFEGILPYKVVLSSEFIPINPNKQYKTELSTLQEIGSGKCYGFVACYDIDKLQIDPLFVLEAGQADLVLTQDAVQGDTVLHFNDVSAGILLGHSHKFIKKRGYQNSKGESYDIYSRYAGYSYKWLDDATDIDTVNNTITLATGIPANMAGVIGDKYCHALNSGTYKYSFTNGAVSQQGNGWQHFSNSMQGIDNLDSSSYSKFFNATAFIKVGFLVNYGQTVVSTKNRFTNFGLYEQNLI